MTDDIGTPYVWGYLEPLVSSPGVCRIDLDCPENGKGGTSITFGRDETNNFVLRGAGVTGLHATIQWNGERNLLSLVTITDSSLNGTFVLAPDARNVSVDEARLSGPAQLFEGSIVCFGSPVPVVAEEADYRYTFHPVHGRSGKEPLFVRYALGIELGRGNYGAVFKAKEKVSGTSFAVKIAYKGQDDGERRVSSAGQEAMALMKMEHQNICKLHEMFFSLDGRVCDIVLEFVDGVTLEAFLYRSLSEDHVKELSYQVCTAIAYMHGEGISHGDIKPNNILVAGTERPIIKVADFGLARVTDNMNMEQLVTRHAWSAPEAPGQWEASLSRDPNKKPKPITIAQSMLWDAWSVGCILYSLLCEKAPLLEAPDSRIVDIYIDLAPFGARTVAKDLVKRLLTQTAENRLPVRWALEHYWFAGHVPYQLSFADVPFAAVPESETFEAPAPGMDVDSDTNVEGGNPPAARPRVRRRGQPKPRGVSRVRPGPSQLTGRPARPARPERPRR